MGWDRFVVELAGTLVWPATVAFGIVALRSPILGMFIRLDRFKWKDFEAIFGKELAKAEETGTKIFVDKTRVETEIASNAEFIHLSKLAEVSPEATILMAWRELERAVGQRLQRDESYRPVISNAKKLLRSVDSDSLALYNYLRKLRNMVAHSKELYISQVDAIEYARLAFLLMIEVRHVVRSGPPDGEKLDQVE